MCPTSVLWSYLLNNDVRHIEKLSSTRHAIFARTLHSYISSTSVIQMFHRDGGDDLHKRLHQNWVLMLHMYTHMLYLKNTHISIFRTTKCSTPFLHFLYDQKVAPDLAVDVRIL